MSIRNLEMLDPLIAAQLTSDDDPAFWDLATNTILGDAAQIDQDNCEGVFAQVGSCRHWIRPHGMRWTAAGGFSWPAGYDKNSTGFSYRALPAFDWSVFLRWTGTAWQQDRTAGRCFLLRIAIPARTTRHLQAAVHTIWCPRSPLSKEKIVQLYGFRKKENCLQLTATEVVRCR